MMLGGEVVDRLTAAKAVLADFLDRRVGDRVGLLVFGQRAYALTPLTLDRDSVREQLQDSVIGLAGRETAIGDTIGLAVKRLRTQPAEQRVLILLTDGVNTAGLLDPLKAAELAHDEGVRIHTIAFGGEGEGMSVFGFRVPMPGGADQEIDEATLQRIATLTGGRAFRARDTEQLAGIYAEIDRLEPIRRPGQSVRPRVERYPWPLAAALACALLAFAWPRTAARRRRRAGSQRDGRRVLVRAVRFPFPAPAVAVGAAGIAAAGVVVARAAPARQRVARRRSIRTCCRICSTCAAGAREWPHRCCWPCAASALAVLALAGPTWRKVDQPLLQGQAPLVIALDLSSAVLANDLPPSRLLQARAKIGALLRAACRRPGRAGGLCRRCLHRRAADRRCRQRRAVPRRAGARRDAGRRQPRRARDRMVDEAAQAGRIRARRHPVADRPRQQCRTLRRHRRGARRLPCLGARPRQRARCVLPEGRWRDRAHASRRRVAAHARRCRQRRIPRTDSGPARRHVARRAEVRSHRRRGHARTEDQCLAGRRLLAAAAADAAGAARVPSRRRAGGVAVVRLAALATVAGGRARHRIGRLVAARRPTPA